MKCKHTYSYFMVTNGNCSQDSSALQTISVLSITDLVYLIFMTSQRVMVSHRIPGQGMIFQGM